MAEEREDRIRQRAYAIWEREGRPEGREEEHWRQASAETAAEEAGSPRQQGSLSSGDRQSGSTGRARSGQQQGEMASDLRQAGADEGLSSGQRQGGTATSNGSGMGAGSGTD